MGDEQRDGPTTGGGALADLSGDNVFVLSSSMDAGKRAACTGLFRRTPPADTNALVVTYRESAEQWLSHYESKVGRRPARLTVLRIGESRDQAGAGGTTQPSEADVERIESPNDLTGIGIRISEYFREAATSRHEAGPGEVAICFDSITALLQYTSVSEAFRFLHVVTNRVRQIGATAHYHLVPGAHDEQTISTLASLFDAQVDATAGPDPEDWTVK